MVCSRIILSLFAMVTHLLTHHPPILMNLLVICLYICVQKHYLSMGTIPVNYIETHVSSQRCYLSMGTTQSRVR